MTRFDYCCRTDQCAGWNKGAHLAGNLLVLWIRAADGGDGRRLILEWETCSLGGGTPAGSAGVDSEEQALIKPLSQDSVNCFLHPREAPMADVENMYIYTIYTDWALVQLLEKGLVV